eukprot:m.152096 g.152096  ORF g.152096 m.152096 type:complete len:771 (-) comp9774_c0_seq4:385-2697(-)
MWHRRQKKEAYNTDHSRVVSHHSTTSAQRRLTAESGRDPVHSPWYDRRHREEVGNALCMVFGTMSADARMKVYADASVTSWPAQPAQPALAASKVVSISHIRQTRCHEVVRLHDRCGCCINWLLSDCFPTCAMTPAEKLKHWEDKVARNDAKTTDMDKEIEDVMARINELKAEKKKRALDDDERAELATLPQDLHDLNAKLTAHLNVSAKDTAILDKLLTQQGPDALLPRFRSLAVTEPPTGYFFSTDSSPQDVAAVANLFKPANIVDHPTVMDFCRGMGEPPTDAAVAAAQVADTHTNLWGKCDWGLYAIRAPLENDSEHGFLAALRILIPESHDVDGWPNRTWAREITIRHPLGKIPKSVGAGLGSSAGNSNKDKYILDGVLFVRQASTKVPEGAPYLRPAVVLEFGLRGSADKPLQLQKYAMNVATDLFAPTDGGCIFAVVVIFDGLGPMVGLKVDAYWQTPLSEVVDATNHRCLAMTNLVNIEGLITRDKLEAVFNGLRAALINPQQQLVAGLYGVSNIEQRFCVAADGYVYKFFNNLQRKAEADIVRSTVVWAALSRCEIVAGRPPATKADELEQVIIIRYRLIEGGHIASTIAQFVAIINDLHVIHQVGFCHADVREANIVFAIPANGSKLIDLDLSGRANIDTYPPRYYTIPDGLRHPAALPNATMVTAHDRFSLAAIMGFYEPDDASRVAWAEAIRVLPLDHGLLAARDVLMPHMACGLARVGGPAARFLPTAPAAATSSLQSFLRPTPSTNSHSGMPEWDS